MKKKIVKKIKKTLSSYIFYHVLDDFFLKRLFLTLFQLFIFILK